MNSGRGIAISQVTKIRNLQNFRSVAKIRNLLNFRRLQKFATCEILQVAKISQPCSFSSTFCFSFLLVSELQL